MVHKDNHMLGRHECTGAIQMTERCVDCSKTAFSPKVTHATGTCQGDERNERRSTVTLKECALRWPKKATLYFFISLESGTAHHHHVLAGIRGFSGTALTSMIAKWFASFFNGEDTGTAEMEKSPCWSKHQDGFGCGGDEGDCQYAATAEFEACCRIVVLSACIRQGVGAPTLMLKIGEVL